MHKKVLTQFVGVIIFCRITENRKNPICFTDRTKAVKNQAAQHFGIKERDSRHKIQRGHGKEVANILVDR